MFIHYAACITSLLVVEGCRSDRNDVDAATTTRMDQPGPGRTRMEGQGHTMMTKERVSGHDDDGVGSGHDDETTESGPSSWCDVVDGF